MAGKMSPAVPSVDSHDRVTGAAAAHDAVRDSEVKLVHDSGVEVGRDSGVEVGHDSGVRAVRGSGVTAAPSTASSIASYASKWFR